MTANNISVWIGIIAAIATAGVSWGVNSEKISRLESDMKGQEDIRQKQSEIREQQIRMEERQKQMFENIEKILEKVDR